MLRYPVQPTVLPTAAGETAAAWMVIAEMLERTNGWALMIAPTAALVKQHLDDLELVFDKDSFQPISMSGAILPPKEKACGTGRLVVSTSGSSQRC